MKQDHKNFIFIKIPKQIWEEKINNKEGLTFEELKEYRREYEYKNIEKKYAARKVAANRKKENIKKICRTLKNYYFNNLFYSQEDITRKQLSKLTSISYRRIIDLWKELELDKWIERFKREGKDALFDFEIFLQNKYDLIF